MDRRIEHALALLHARIATPLSIDRLAHAANLSPSRFAHLFRREVGTPPARYMRALRMTCARLLLERTSLSVKEVMAQVGCNDPSHFTRDFQRCHGRTPTHWRQSVDLLANEHGDPPGERLDVKEIARLANRRQDAPTQSPRVLRAREIRLHSHRAKRAV